MIQLTHEISINREFYEGLHFEKVEEQNQEEVEEKKKEREEEEKGHKEEEEGEWGESRSRVLPSS